MPTAPLSHIPFRPLGTNGVKVSALGDGGSGGLTVQAISRHRLDSTDLVAT
jgi:hypothetical protein